MSNNLPATQHERRQVPAIDELYQDIELSSKYNDLNRLLNCPPKPQWVRVNTLANNSNYLPIGIVEYLLTSIFLKWRVEIKSTQLIANSVVVAVRLHVLDPITGEWDWQDGIGGSPIQTAKGASATDFTQVKSAAVQMAAPAAESYAFKDAAEKFGKLFGKDLNRKEENLLNYGNLENKLNVEKKDGIPDELKTVIAEADAENLVLIYKTNTEYHSIPLFMQLLAARQIQLKAEKHARNGQPA